MERPLIISTPRKAIDKLNKIRSEFEQIKNDKLMHEQRIATTPPSLSLVDYMNSKGMNSHWANRDALAKQFGMKDYHGTTEHNARLLTIMQAQGQNQQNQPEQKPNA